ncbi:MAG: hypothetical protein JO006_14310 [Paucibacter sp.]|nr:hypothetical protein [Roseateles sp.]
MKTILGCALLLLVAGCATTPQLPPATPPIVDADAQRRSEFDKSLDSWTGAPLAELKSRLGKPSSVSHGSGAGRTVYAFTKSSGSFRCTVRYFVDDKTQRVQGHQIDGC